MCHLFCTVCTENKILQCPKRTLLSFLTPILTYNHTYTQPTVAEPQPCEGLQTRASSLALFTFRQRTVLRQPFCRTNSQCSQQVKGRSKGALPGDVGGHVSARREKKKLGRLVQERDRPSPFQSWRQMESSPAEPGPTCGENDFITSLSVSHCPYISQRPCLRRRSRLFSDQRSAVPGQPCPQLPQKCE